VRRDRELCERVAGQAAAARSDQGSS
jgi:hypothetical protein